MLGSQHRHHTHKYIENIHTKSLRVTNIFNPLHRVQLWWFRYNPFARYFSTVIFVMKKREKIVVLVKFPIRLSVHFGALGDWFLFPTSSRTSAVRQRWWVLLKLVKNEVGVTWHWVEGPTCGVAKLKLLITGPETRWGVMCRIPGIAARMNREWESKKTVVCW